MPKKYFIAGDWGTSNLRLYLCQFNHSSETLLLDTKFGEGINVAKSDYENQFFSLAQDWLDEYGLMPVILSGMVGSNIGWKETPYLSCPVDCKQIANGRVCFDARGIEFSILAGLNATNPLGAPDLMRGEELQLLGWMLQHQNGGIHDRLFALPGTHNKWSLVSRGNIETFLTAFTGELFGLLRKDSILINNEKTQTFSKDAFLSAVRAIENLNGAHLVHTLFSTRSKQIMGEMPMSDSSSYISGLITGSDVVGALNLFKVKQAALPITIIGEDVLSQQYLHALQYFDIEAESCNPTEIALSGFAAIYQSIYET